MRRALLIFGIMLLAVAASVTALLFFVDVNQFRGPIQTQLQRSLDRPVTLGPLGLSLLPLSIRVPDLRIGESPAFPSPHPFASANELSVRVGLLPLLKGQIAVRSLRLNQPLVELIRNENGTWNYSSISGAGQGGGDRTLSIDELEIVDGSVAITDRASRKPRVVYQHIDLRLRDFAPGKRLNLDLTARLAGSGQTITLQAQGTGLNDLEGRLSIPQGALSLDKTRLHKSDLGFGIQADYRIGYDTNRELLEIRSLNARLGTTPVSASGEVNLRAKPSELRFQLAVKNASITELARLAGVPGELKGTASLDARAQGALDRPEAWIWTGSGSIANGSIRYGNIVLTEVHAGCAIDGGLIKLAPVTARLYGGRQSGSIVVDMRRGHPAFTINTKLDQVDANQLLSATTSLKQTLYGLLATNADLQFAARPGEDIARTLNGSMNLKLHQGKLAGINLLNEVASIARFIGFRKSAEVATNVVDLTGDLNVTNGVVRTENVKMTLEDGSALAAGMMNLVDQTLDMRLLVTLHKGLSAQVGGSKIGGFMSTALGNENGELIVPVVVSGTFAKPRVTPDAERFAKMKLRSLVPGAGSTAAPGNITDSVGGIVDLFRRKKKQ
jgi:AsmA protein